VKLEISIDGKRYEVEVEALEEDSGPKYRDYSPPPAPTTIHTMPVPVAPTQAVPAEEGVDEAKVCRSPVAGLVNRINVQPGQQLQADDLLIVLEAMKMETNVTAPEAGKVKTVRVQQGDAVKVNQILIEFE
jgi:methylmalonyl-CoA carboxyltransferase small subunit